MNIPEWDSNSSTKECVICQSKWTLTNRRHHCRQCGRLVCERCSSYRIILDKLDQDEQVTSTVTSRRSSLGNRFSRNKKNANRPQRVCKGCFKTLNVKKERDTEINYQREREKALLNATSLVADTLLRVYFLDCSSKTICYDDTTTAADVCLLTCQNIPVALFEVVQDIKDPDQYRLVLSTESISDIVSRWKFNASSTAKLVVPIYNMELKKNASLSQISATKTVNLIKNNRNSLYGLNDFLEINENEGNHTAVSDATERTETSKANNVVKRLSLFSSRLSTASVTSNSFDPSSLMSMEDDDEQPPAPIVNSGINSCTDDIESMKQQLNDMQKKYNMLKSLFSKKQNNKDNNNVIGLYGSSDSYKRITDSGLLQVPNSSDTNSHASNNNNQMSSSLSPTRKFMSSGGKIPMSSASYTAMSTATSSPSANSYYKRMGRQTTLAASPAVTMVPPPSVNNNNFQSAFDMKVIADNYNSTYESSSPMKQSKRITTFDSNNIPYSPASSVYSNVSSNSDVNNSLLLGRDDITQIFDNVMGIAGNNSNNKSDTAQVAPDFTLLSRTFFFQLYGIESFCQRFDRLLAGLIRGQASSSSDDVPKKFVFNPSEILQLYEMVTSLGGLYEFVLQFTEDWNTIVKDWLLNLFKSELEALPLPRQYLSNVTTPSNTCGTEMLAAVVSCLDRENLIFEEDAAKILNDILEVCVEGGVPGPATPKGLTMSYIITLLKNLSDTLEFVIQLIKIFPPEINLIQIYTELLMNKLKNSIAPFISNNKGLSSIQETHRLLLFFDQHIRLLCRFGIDVSFIVELSNELLKQLVGLIVKILKNNLVALQDSEEKFMPEKLDGRNGKIGVCSKWPRELIKHTDEVLTLVVQGSYLLSQSRETLITTIIADGVKEFVASKQNPYLNKLKQFGLSSVESTPNLIKLIAFINNHHELIDSLNERKDIIINNDEIDDSGKARLNELYTMTVMTINEQQNLAVTSLINGVCFDIKESLKLLFKSNDTSNFAAVYSALGVSVKRSVHDASICSSAVGKLVNDLMKFHDNVLTVMLNQINKDTFLSIIIRNILSYVVETYIEMLLVNGIVLSANTHEILNGDVQLLQLLHTEYGHYLIGRDVVGNHRLESALKPIVDIIHLFRIMPRAMPEFVINDLQKDFGPATIKVWHQIMGIRGESKQVVDAIQASIVPGLSTSYDTATNFHHIAALDQLKVKKFK